MTTLYKKLANGKIVLMTFLLVAGFAAYLFPTYSAGYRQPTDPDVIDLQLSFSHERFTQIVSLWLAHKGEAAISAFQSTLIVLDIAFPLIYATFLAALFAWLSPVMDAVLNRKQQALFCIPYLAAAMDLIENAIHYSLFSKISSTSLGGLSAQSILAASIFASIKMILIGVSLLTSVFYALRLAARWLRGKLIS